MKRSFALVLLTALAAACSGGSSKPSSVPLDRTLIGDYAATVGAVSDHLHAYAAALNPCTSGTYDCIFQIISSGAAASFLVSHLAEADATPDPSSNVPASLTALIATTTTDATVVMKQAASMSRFSRVAIGGFRDQLTALLTDIDAWQPTGAAGQIMSADQIQVPLAPPANLHVQFNVRPLLYIKQDADFATFTRSGSQCQGTGLFSDLKRGASVTVYDAAGQKVIGIGYVDRSFITGDKCALVADVKNLPPEPFYQVRFTNRNKVAFSARELLTQTADVTIG